MSDGADYQITLSEAQRAVVVHAAGELDVHAHAEFVLMLARASAGDRNVIVDLSATTFIDSTGLRALFEVWHSQTAAGRGFALRSPSPPVRRTLENAGLEATFPIIHGPGDQET